MNRSNAIACMLLWVFAIVCVSCHFARNAPATQPIALSANEAITHSQAARTLIIDAQGDATQRSKPILIEAVDRTDKAIAAEKVVIEETAAVQKFADAALAKIAALEKKVEQTKQEGEERWQKEHDANEWVGWRTKAIIAWILGAGFALTLLGLFLNAKTNWFVYVWNFAVGIVAGLFKMFGTVFGGIVKLFDKAKGPTS